MSRAQRNTIFVEEATVLDHAVYPGDQFVLRLHAPECARHATPGSFVHIQCEPEIPMRRPLSIMRANGTEGWIELLYKIVGEGLRMLGRAAPGDQLNVLGPIGRGFRPDVARPRPVLVGGGVGIPPLVFLAEHLAAGNGWAPVAFFGSELPFPFALTDSADRLPGVPAAVNRTLVLLEDWRVPGRLASGAGFVGCHDGVVTDLARDWLREIPAQWRDEACIFACGPEPMLRAAQALATEFRLPSELCLEEFMACAVGGCAGCTVPVHTPEGTAMRRVCVDGPVFPGEQIYAK